MTLSSSCRMYSAHRCPHIIFRMSAPCHCALVDATPRSGGAGDTRAHLWSGRATPHIVCPPNSRCVRRSVWCRYSADSTVAAFDCPSHAGKRRSFLLLGLEMYQTKPSLVCYVWITKLAKKHEGICCVGVEPYVSNLSFFLAT